ncbi:hypothetical protein ABGB17_21880 [Sphaerisporangium sp. B11E5]|uniref:hypothetical protein n=1 Tax=Sphaerisporangium sp. B11E5 TaxID=3153563 RepID=UPI00325F82F2
MAVPPPTACGRSLGEDGDEESAVLVRGAGGRGVPGAGRSVWPEPDVDEVVPPGVPVGALKPSAGVVASATEPPRDAGPLGSAK